MENLIKPTKALSNLNEMDFYYRELIKEFLQSLSPSYNRTNIILILRQLYESFIEDSLLKSQKDGSLLISKITIEHILKFQAKIENRVNNNEISQKYAQLILHYLRMFCKFLFNKQIVNIFYKPINFLKIDAKSTNKQMDSLLSNYIQYLKKKNYAIPNNYVKSVKKFLKFSGYTSELANSNFWEIEIKKYEDALRMEVIKESLAPSSAYQYLQQVRTFYIFLYEENIVRFKYKIPKSFKTVGKRRNKFVPTGDLLLLINKILECSLNSLRDISIFLILIETGCRPIEIVNIEINDIAFTEKLLILKSKKSHQRTLKISYELVSFIKEYLKIRPNYLSDPNVTSLFLNSNGNPITTATIYECIRHNNQRAFGSIKFSPNSLRHTFITNALNNNNDIDKVAKIVGHKDFSVTMGYFYRNLESIKQLAIGKELNLGKVDKDGN